jgi:hypothetical protein
MGEVDFLSGPVWMKVLNSWHGLKLRLLSVRRAAKLCAERLDLIPSWPQDFGEAMGMAAGAHSTTGLAPSQKPWATGPVSVRDPGPPW